MSSRKSRREEHEKLVLNLLHGRYTWTKAGRLYHEYLSGDKERLAIDALKHLTSCKDQALNSAILVTLVALLDPDGSTERRLVFKFRKKGTRNTSLVSDHQIANHVRWRVHVGDPVEAAVQDAMATYGLSRKTVYEIMRRIKKPNVSHL
jgi:hypothetical protein